MEENKSFEIGNIIVFLLPTLSIGKSGFSENKIPKVGKITSTDGDFFLVRVSNRVSFWVANRDFKMATKKEIIQYTLNSMLDE